MTETDLRVELPVRAGIIAFEGVTVSGDDAGARELEACGARYRERYGEGASPGAVDGIQIARELFRAFGIDPTKRRPSSESLLNRALKGKPMPAVSSLVDAGNWCSLDFLLPLGLYDVERLRGPIALRGGREGDVYDAISGKPLNLDGRTLLADDEGAFGSPITDSRRTAVTEATTRALVLLWAPMSYQTATLEQRAKELGERVVGVCGGAVVEQRVIEG